MQRTKDAVEDNTTTSGIGPSKPIDSSTNNIRTRNQSSNNNEREDTTTHRKVSTATSTNLNQDLEDLRLEVHQQIQVGVLLTMF